MEQGFPLWCVGEPRKKVDFGFDVEEEVTKTHLPPISRISHVGQESELKVLPCNAQEKMMGIITNGPQFFSLKSIIIPSLVLKLIFDICFSIKFQMFLFYIEVSNVSFLDRRLYHKYVIYNPNILKN